MNHYFNDFSFELPDDFSIISGTMVDATVIIFGSPERDYVIAFSASIEPTVPAYIANALVRLLYPRSHMYDTGYIHVDIKRDSDGIVQQLSSKETYGHINRRMLFGSITNRCYALTLYKFSDISESEVSMMNDIFDTVSFDPAGEDENSINETYEREDDRFQDDILML